jgi:poly-gamma-glutamate synthesis protein (capsule biosynthesis protein)
LYRVPYVPVAIALVAALALLLNSCFAEQRTEQSQKARPEKAVSGQPGTPASDRKPPEEAPSEPPRSLVPVTHLTSTRESVSAQELSQEQDLSVLRGYLEAAQKLLDRSDFEAFDSADAVLEHVSRTPGAVGLVPWDAVDPRVKALAVNGEPLLEAEAGDPEDYPLSPDDATGPDPDELRRVVVGGDIVLDRGQNYMVIQQGMGLDFPLDGGYAAVTSRVPEQSVYSETGIIHQFTAERRGGAGEVREYLRSADLTLANFENPVIEAAVWHPDGTTFTGEPRLLPVLDQAGIDGVTLGNNHILDAGVAGLKETRVQLADAGISYAGAGMDLAEAREPMIFELGDTKIGVLSYQGVPYYDWAWATETAPGTAPLVESVMREDIEWLRPEVDLLAVMPHWGKEYIATPEPDQVKLAHAAIEEGADLFIGGHAHWPKGIEIYKGKPIYYGVGNFLLDQSWSEETSTGIFAEVTLYEDEVIQTRPVPFIMLDYAQPNFLVPDGGGDRALRNIFSASLGPEFRTDGTNGSSGGGPKR